MKKFSLILLFIFISSTTLFATGWGDTFPNGVKGNWGSWPKAVHGDDGGKWLTDLDDDFDGNKLNLANSVPGWGDSSLMRPVGDGTWEIKMTYSPGYVINKLTILYSEKCSTDLSDSTDKSLWWDNDGKREYSVTNITIPSSSDTYYLNFNDTPDVSSAYDLSILPDSGALYVRWKKTSEMENSGINGTDGCGPTMGDVDSADTGSDYGYKLYRSPTASGPYTWIGNSDGSGTYITAGQYTDPSATWRMRFTDDSGGVGLTNGDTYYYVVLAVDAYSVVGDTSSEFNGSPGGYIDVWFKVEGADMKVIENSDGWVYLTPYIHGRAFFFNKVKAKLAWASPRDM